MHDAQSHLGFRSYDHDWKSTESLILNLVDIASKGGNYLLNVGPTSLGEIPGPSVERLRQVGAWMKINGEAIYGTTASPFEKLDWGRCTKRQTPGGTTLYLHVFNWPTDGKLVLPAVSGKILSATLLATGAKLPVNPGATECVLTLPATAPDNNSSTISLKLEGAVQVGPPPDVPKTNCPAELRFATGMCLDSLASCRRQNTREQHPTTPA